VKIDKTKLCIRRGDIFLIELGYDSQGNIIKRPVLVIQNDIGNRFCNTVIVVPLILESKIKKLYFSVSIKASHETGLTKSHVAIFSQIRTLEKKLFSNDCYLGRITDDIIIKMDRAIEISLGLSVMQRLENNCRKSI
jgi:mRNA interferase MazF